MVMFREMRRSEVLPNEMTLTSVVKACMNLGDLKLGMS